MTAFAKRRVFDAVFPSSAYTTSATPAATPVLGAGTFGESFASSQDEKFGHFDPAAETVKWERAWHVVTDFLALPRETLRSHHADGKNVSPFAQFSNLASPSWFKPCTADVSRAIAYTCLHGPTTNTLLNVPSQNVYEWYLYEVGRHFQDYEFPRLAELRAAEGFNHLVRILDILGDAQATYLFPLDKYILPYIVASDRHRQNRGRFLESYHAIVQQTLARTSIAEQLRDCLNQQSALVLGIESLHSQDDDTMNEDLDAVASRARERILSLLKALQIIGLGDSAAQVIFAEVMSGLLEVHVEKTYAGRWLGPSTILQELRTWVEDHFARFVVEVLVVLQPPAMHRETKAPQVTLTDVTSWQQKAIRDLGSLRIKEMFDIIISWESSESNNRGAIEDLRPYLKTPAARLHLTTSFSQEISARLLLPSASTTEILQVYICIVRAFAFLDSKGILLDRVARPIREYLRDREDTIKIIVGGLLADSEADKDNPDVLVDLALELTKISDVPGEDGDGEDWDDMTWLPDPVDADLGFKKVKGLDVVGTLISLFETKDVFVREFQVILGARLLKNDQDLDKEIRVLELLKLRFGEGPLQACEVMLRDILDSRRVDTAIWKDESMAKPSSSLQFRSRILSRLFWPSLLTETFTIPPAVHSLQGAYSQVFESLKASRKLTWLPALGQVTVELQLADRTVIEDCQPWQASVIDAFASATTPSTKNVATLTIQDLIAKLEMSEALVQNALTFWVSKLVLQQTAPHAYAVLEKLPLPASTTTLATNDSQTHASATTTTSTALIEAAASAAAASVDMAASSTAAATGVFSLAESSAKNEELDVVWQYVQGMLTNVGAMPAARIMRMLNMTIPGGSSLTTAGLKEFLGERVTEGKLELGKGGYKLIK